MTKYFSSIALVIWAMTSLASAIAQEAKYKPPEHHSRIEAIARGTAYEGGNTANGPDLDKDPGLRTNLKNNDLELLDSIDDRKTGMQAMVLRDRRNNETYVAFRGTFPNMGEGGLDAAADAESSGNVGNSQYSANQAKLDEWAKTFPNATVTGHSLGAALGQRYISENPNSYSEGVLFNAPAIDRRFAHRFAQEKNTGPVTIYVGRSQRPEEGNPQGNGSVYDLVSEMGGQSHLPARIVEVTDTTTALTQDPADNDSVAATVLGAPPALLGNSHTFTMLDNLDGKVLNTIPYDEFQSRRRESWNEASTRIGALQALTVGVDASIIALRELAGIEVGAAIEQAARVLTQQQLPAGTVSETAEAVAGLAQGYGNIGPSIPTLPMLRAGDRAAKPEPYERRAREAARARAATLIAAIDRDLRTFDGYLRGLEGYCASLAGSVARGGEDFDRGIRAITDSAIEKARALIKVDANMFRAVTKLLPVVSRSSERAQEKGKIACSIAGGSKDDIAGIKDAVLKARNHAVLAAQIATKASSVGRKVAARKQDIHASLPSPKELGAKIAARLAAHVKMKAQACKITWARGENLFNPDPRTAISFGSALEKMQALSAVIDGLDAADKLEFTLEHAELQNRYNLMKKEVSIGPACQANHDKMREICSRFVPKSVSGILGAYEAAVDEVTSLRRTSGASLSRALDRMDEEVFAAEEAVRKGRNCLAEAQKDTFQLTEEAREKCRKEADDKGKVYGEILVGKNEEYHCILCETDQKYQDGKCLSPQLLADDSCRKQARDQGRTFGKAIVNPSGPATCMSCEGDEEYKDGKCFSPEQIARDKCRIQAENNGRVYIKTVFQKNGQAICHSCPRGQTYQNGKCISRTEFARAGCRRMAAGKGKVYARTQFLKNGQVKCHWCEPGQYYRNGKCQSPQAQPRAQPNTGGRFKPLYLCSYQTTDGSLLGNYGTQTRQHYAERPIPGQNCSRVR